MRGRDRGGGASGEEQEAARADRDEERSSPSHTPTVATAAYIGLGSNLGDREERLLAAVAELRATAGVRVRAVSSIRETEPVGLADQPRFLNAVAAIETTLDPLALLGELLAVESRLGRVRSGPRFGPRTIDLDLLLFGDLELGEPGLILPHPRLHERAFVLEPLAELAPGLVVPGRGPVETLLTALQ